MITTKEYDACINGICNEMKTWYTVSGVLKEIRAVQQNTNGGESNLGRLFFLVDPKYKDAEEWVKKALFDFEFLEVFSPIRKEINAESVDATMKCLIVKRYREICKLRRKAIDKREYTDEETCMEILRSLAN